MTDAPQTLAPIDTNDRAELEKTEQWYRDRGDLPAAARVRRYLDYIAPPAAQRRAIDDAIELRQSQLRQLVVLSEDPDIALLAAQHMAGDSVADEIGVYCYDGPNIHCADIIRVNDGVRLEIWSEDWPYQRPTVGRA
jgi:hypothetical protein